MSIDPNDFLTGGGVPSAKFPEIGTLVKGVVLDSIVNEQTDLDGKVKSFDNGDPMMQVVITLQTDERDPSIDDDDGKRKLYVKGQMRIAVGEALKKAGAKLENGGTLAVKYHDDKPAEKKGHNPAKQYVAQYLPGSSTAANDLLGGSEPSAPAAPAGVASDDLI